MWESISKNWGHLATIGVILAAGFGAGLWLKTSLDALETLPGSVEELQMRLAPLEGLPEEIEKSRCVLLAQTEMAKNDVKMYTVDLEIEAMKERTSAFLEQPDPTPQEERKFEALQHRRRQLEEHKKEFQEKREKHLSIINLGRCP